jgi:hypothetical protein
MNIPGLSTIVGKIVSIGTEAIRAKLNQEEAVIRALKTLGIGINPENNFDSIYMHALVNYGIFKPEAILNFFRNDHIREAFRQSYYTGDPGILIKEAEGIIDWNRETNLLGRIDYDPRLEFKEFTGIFDEIVARLRTPAEAKRDIMISEIIKQVTEIKQGIKPAETYNPRINREAQNITGKDKWIQSKLVYQLELPQEPSEENIQALKATISEWKFITTSSLQPIVSIANGILGIGQTDGVTFDLSPVKPIDNCSIECDILIVAYGNDPSNWAGLRVRAFDFAYDFRLGYLVYIRRSGQVELYGPEGILAGLNHIVVPDPSATWTRLRVDILDSEIRVFVNGAKHIAIADKTFGGRGRIYLNTFGTHAQFKSFKVYELQHA